MVKYVPDDLSGVPEYMKKQEAKVGSLDISEIYGDK